MTNRPIPLRRRFRGFTFTEVLFAVMILGIGFILIAAVLPVAIRQSRQNVDEQTARNLAGEALAKNKLVAKNVTMSPTGAAPAPWSVWEWGDLSGDHISTLDRRFQWHVLYSRAIGDPSAKVMVLVTRLPKEIGGSNVYQQSWLNNGANRPQIALADLTDGSPDTIKFTDAEMKERAVAGAYVVNSKSGDVYRLAALSGATADTWTLDPTSADIVLTSPTPNPSPFNVILLGAAPRDPTVAWDATTNPHEGPSQDIYLLPPQGISVP